MRRLLLALIMAWAGLAAHAMAAEPVFPQGLRVGLTPPGDARLSSRFSGFEDTDRKVAITILDLPGRAYADLEAAAFGKDLRGLEDMKRQSFPFESGIGILVSGRLRANGDTVYKWLLLATAVGGPEKDLTALVTATVPEAARSVYSDAAIRQALASVTFRPTPIGEQLALLPFELDDLAGFRVLRVLADGAVILTDGPTDNLNAQPYVIVSVVRGGPAGAQERGRFARDLIDSAPMRDLRIQSAEAMRLSGGPGHEIRATAKNSEDKALSLVQWLRFGSSGFIRVVAVGGTDAWDALFPRFRAVRDGIAPK